MNIDLGTQLLLLDVVDGVATITINRPKVNALNVEIQHALCVAAEYCTTSDDVAAVVLRGSERAFAAGVDIKEMAAMGYNDMARHVHVMHAAFNGIAAIPKPVIAAVTGYALGGGMELALCADIRIVADTVTFGQPEIKLGIFPGAGGSQRLPRLVGPARAKDIIFTGRTIDASEALAIGLANQVVPAAEVFATADAYARQFVGGPAMALRAAKEAIDHGLATDMATGLAHERLQFAALFATEDRTRGMESFIENGPGKASFVGR